MRLFLVIHALLQRALDNALQSQIILKQIYFIVTKNNNPIPFAWNFYFFPVFFLKIIPLLYNNHYHIVFTSISLTITTPLL